MFLEKYLNETYLNLVESNYEDWYLENIDEDNFEKVYNLLKENGFDFIEDIILNYIELFEYEPKYIIPSLADMKSVLGKNYACEISKNMSLLDKVINLCEGYKNSNRNW